MKVPFLDIKAENDSIKSELQSAIDEVVARASFILGPAVERFEKSFAEYISVEHCIGVNSGTSALHMALVALGVGPGDEVITTPHTWISTCWAISYVGATPVFVDIEPETCTLAPDLLSHAITRRTKAIIPVHLYGHPAKMQELRKFADAHGLFLIEDAAQSHGAMIGDRRVGTFGDVACFSFYPGKNLGAFGEAGAVGTDDSRVADRIRRLRDHAQEGRHNHVELGFNTRMEGLQAAVINAKLPHLDAWNDLRKSHANRYRDRLKNIAEVTIPTERDGCSHVWHLFVIRLKTMQREWLRSQLAKCGITTAVHYPTPIPFQPAYAHLNYRSGDFPVAEKVMESCLSLPMYPYLSDRQIDYVCDELEGCLMTGQLKRAEHAIE